jgi:hypothetical protein
MVPAILFTFVNRQSKHDYLTGFKYMFSSVMMVSAAVDFVNTKTCSVDGYQHFGGTCSPHLQGNIANNLPKFEV